MRYHFQGTLTSGDMKKHIPHDFDLSAGITSLQIRLEFAPLHVHSGMNMLTLTLFDPEGCRGAGHRGDTGLHEISLSAVEATPGYVVRPLPAGRWSIVIDTHSILPDSPVEYQIHITADNQPLPLEEQILPVQSVAKITPKRARGWYRGDLHAHTFHSDGHWDVPDLVAAARRYGLDFVTLTDHNTISPLKQMDSLSSENLLTMGGFELTTFYGHALALGLREWVDWRVSPGKRTMPEIAAEVEAKGGLFIIAHPMSVGDPICTGCDWAYTDMMPGPARVVEIWNTLWPGQSNNEDALALWYSWLNHGYRMVATVGTDVHGPPPAGIHPGFDVVYAEELSETAILNAIRKGHLYVSSGPKLELTGKSADGTSAMMGDGLPAGTADITVCWENCNTSDHLRLIVDGKPFVEITPGEKGEQTWHLNAGQVRWCVVEIRSEYDIVSAVTNPIFIGGDWL